MSVSSTERSIRIMADDYAATQFQRQDARIGSRIMNGKAILGAVAISTLAACATSSGQARPSSAESISRGIAGALKGSSLDSHTKNGCLSSLDFWRDEVADDAPPAKLTGGLFFLGDSYLVANFAYLDGTQRLIWQTADLTKRLDASTAQLAELSDLLVAAHRDSPPKQPTRSMHTTCVVFLDIHGRYYSVQPDDSVESDRSVDRAMTLLDRFIQGTP
ncbi:hypothetical protein ASD55_13890 [Rhodanobacter sp. Root561]|nr:hypothetical protein ASD55_13890 [Rhodanobacter sp. Root561]